MVIADWTAHATDPRLLPSRHRLLELSVTSLRHSDRCTLGIEVKLFLSCCSPFSVVMKQNDPAAACVLLASLSSARH